MNPQIVTKPAFEVVGLRIHTRAMSPEIPALWGQFVPRISEVPGLAEPLVSYGLMDNFDPTTRALDYLAGVTVTTVGNLPAGMTRWKIPAATYAVFETTIPTIGETMGGIYSQWFPTAAYQQAAGLHFERYRERFNPDDSASKFAIFIPVEKRT